MGTTIGYANKMLTRIVQKATGEATNNKWMSNYIIIINQLSSHFKNFKQN